LSEYWWSGGGSNSRPSHCERGAAGVLTLDQARTEATRLLAQAREKGEPEVVTQRRHRAERKAGERVETFGELVKNYVGFIEHEHKAGSVEKTKHRLLTVFAKFADKPLASLDTLSIERWRRDRIKDGLAVATVERDLAALRSALAHAVRHGFVAEHPMREVKRRKFDNARVRHLSGDEEAALREALAARDEAMRKARARARTNGAARGRASCCRRSPRTASAITSRRWCSSRSTPGCAAAS
jgi:hypothetical protein